MLKHLIFTVTNDLNYDQRMIRICNSLATNGYQVTLVGTRNNTSKELILQKFSQQRIKVWATKGPMFYVEYNIKLFLYLLFFKADLFCCIDLDTIMPVYFATILKRKNSVYDAHEYFSQLKEIVVRPTIYKFWHGIEKIFVPKFTHGYTVSKSIADCFKKIYGVEYETIRNIPLLQPLITMDCKDKKIIYQGAVNEGRGFEGLIPAMKKVNAILYIYGDGNYMDQVKKLIENNNVADKVILMGKYFPDDLKKVTAEAYIGINLVENTGLNQYYSLANKFFDYIQSCIPQISMDFPEYKAINDAYHIALLITDTDEINIADALNKLLADEIMYEAFKQNCLLAREELNWQMEEKKLLTFYKNIFE